MAIDKNVRGSQNNNAPRLEERLNQIEEGIKDLKANHRWIIGLIVLALVLITGHSYFQTWH